MSTSPTAMLKKLLKPVQSLKDKLNAKLPVATEGILDKSTETKNSNDHLR